MILITHNCFSNAIAMATEIRVLLPDKEAERTVFLLCPEGGNGLQWITSTKVSVLCDQYKTAFVIVPSLEGCYTDMAYGYNFYSSLKEMVSYISANLPGVPLKEGTCYAVGVSTGGTAALKLALEMSLLFAGAASFSGRLDITEISGGWFTEKRLECLYGTPEQRYAKQKEFEDLCSKNEGQAFLICAKEQDHGVSSAKRIASILGSDTTLNILPGASNWKTWSDWLGTYIDDIGGTDHVRE